MRFLSLSVAALVAVATVTPASPRNQARVAMTLTFADGEAVRTTAIEGSLLDVKGEGDGSKLSLAMVCHTKGNYDVHITLLDLRKPGREMVIASIITPLRHPVSVWLDQPEGTLVGSSQGSKRDPANLTIRVDSITRLPADSASRSMF